MFKDGNKKRGLISIEKFMTKKQRIEDMLPASKSIQAIADVMRTLWVCKLLRPFAIVEDEGLSIILIMLLLFSGGLKCHRGKVSEIM